MSEPPSPRFRRLLVVDDMEAMRLALEDSLRLEADEVGSLGDL
jgi:hypothetical protein